MAYTSLKQKVDLSHTTQCLMLATRIIRPRLQLSSPLRGAMQLQVLVSNDLRRTSKQCERCNMKLKFRCLLVSLSRCVRPSHRDLLCERTAIAKSGFVHDHGSLVRRKTYFEHSRTISKSALPKVGMFRKAHILISFFL